MTSRWWRRRPSADRGYSTVEAAALALPSLLLVAFIVQAVFYVLAVQAAQSAAHKGALAGASWEASPAAGVERAEQWLSAQRMLRDVQVSASGSTQESVQITVHVQPLTLVPGWTWTVRESAEQPVEAP